MNYSLNTFTFHNNGRHLRSPGHITDIQRKLMKWTVARERKGLPTDELHTAIYYLNEYRELMCKSKMINETVTPLKPVHYELPNVEGFVSRL